jgi:hypothetical protein
MSEANLVKHPPLPKFESLKYRVALDHVTNLQTLAGIYTWCYMNCSEWNLLVTNELTQPFKVEFAFNDENEALMFRLSWAY